VRQIAACRACRDPKLDPVLDLGNLAISDFLEPGQEVERAPLCLVRCAGCGLVQLRHTVHRDRLYQTYHYRSSVNEAMVSALADVVTDAYRHVLPEAGDAVLDVGCNDGTLLRLHNNGLRRIGFDPSDVATEAWLRRDFDYDLVRDYFPPRRQHTPTPCKIVTAVAMFYDLDDPGAFLAEVKRWLHPEGVLVLQFQDLESMVQAYAIDNVCHEHLTYWDEYAINRLLRVHGLEIVATGVVPINGGSLRVVARHGDVIPQESWAAVRAQPFWVQTDTGERNVLHHWVGWVQDKKRDTVALLRRLRAEGKTIYGIAASTKFNTLSQFYGIGPDLITAIGERSPAKVGKTTVTGIPIVSEQAMRDARPDYLFCCAWQFADAFAEREKDLLDQGTQFIVPLPTLRVIGGDRAGLLSPVS
jgi:NDP-4-keto-2,6-dideoxyhexose 3-C-methyltransferase